MNVFSLAAGVFFLFIDYKLWEYSTVVNIFIKVMAECAIHITVLKQIISKCGFHLIGALLYIFAKKL